MGTGAPSVSFRPRLRAGRGERLARPLIPGPVHAALPIVIVALWAVAIDDVRLREMSDLGLISVLPPTVFALLFALTASFCLALTRRPLRPLVPAIHVLTLIVVLYGITSFLEPEPRFESVWKHVGVTDYIAQNGSVDPNIDAYFNWPGFFAFGALLTELAGFDNLLPIAGWGPLAFNLLFLAPLTVIFRSLTDDRRLLWLALWAFYSTNWVAQDYIAPQALGFLLWLTILALLIAWFVPPGPELPRGRMLLELPRRLLRHARGPHPSEAHPKGADVSRDRAIAVVLVVLLFAAIVTGHQLSPFPAVTTVIGLVLLARLEPRTLPIGMVVILAAFISYMTVAYLQGHIEELTGSVGSVGENINSGVGARLNGSADHELIVQLRVLGSLAIGLGALAGFARRVRSGRLDIALLVVGIAPLLLPVLQPYGGEMILRVFLFALPAIAFFVACMAFPSPDAGRTWSTPVTVACVGCAMLVLFIFMRNGNERLEHFTEGDVAAVGALYRIAPRGSTLVAGTGNLPWRYRDYAAFDHRRVPDVLPSWREPVPRPQRLARELIGRFGAGDAYLIVTRSTTIDASMIAGKPGVLEGLVRELRASSRAREVFRNEAGVIFRLEPPPPG